MTINRWFLEICPHSCFAGNATSVFHPGASCNVSYEESRVFLVSVYSSVCALGIPANFLTAWLTLLQALQGNVLAVYLFCLALCELLYASTLPLWILYIQNQHHWVLGPRACKVTAYIFFCNIYVSILFLCCISLDRLCAVAYALESRGCRRQKTAIYTSVCVFLLVGLVHVPVFYMKEERTCFEELPTRTISVYYYLRFVFGFALPLVFIAFNTQLMLRSIRRSMGLSEARKAKVKRFSVAIVLIFLVCFAPYHVVLFIKALAVSLYGADVDAVCTVERSLYTASVVFLGLATVNSVADPIIYMLATEHSRQKVSQIHREWRAWATRADHTRLTSSKDMGTPMSPSDLASCQSG
ncbi:PREDICTED: probable G-protein coupled receptor 132 [Elephantulus edwardii]|uniref:probable G-protein coupled receptor 132 n=1 Tax=Elephantulus edwardii TaxID=28737 RepID=UPI0003F0F11A|nr:PREDICTED: probable G-protein coupled receptor 132 [Elephantulus edwardii]